MRNHVAKALWTPKFKSKKIQSKKIYSRKQNKKESYDV